MRGADLPVRMISRDFLPFAILVLLLAVPLGIAGWSTLRTAWQGRGRPMTPGRKVAFVLLLGLGGVMLLLALGMGGCAVGIVMEVERR